MNSDSDEKNKKNKEEDFFDLDYSLTSPGKGDQSSGQQPSKSSDSPPADARNSLGDMPTGGSSEEVFQSLASGQMFAGRYQILERIGAGGMGEVYRVKDTLDGGIVALKRIREEIAVHENVRKRFIQEARISQKISGWNIVRVYDVNQVDNILYYTMEFLDGQTLRGCLNTLISQERSMSLDEIRHLIAEICKGLEDAHRVTLHRDLKPENIFILKSGEIKLLDFGLARALEGSGLTVQGQRMGTPYYMAPEQLSSSGKHTPALDLYSLGVILYELLTLTIPMAGMEDVHKLRKDVTSEMDVFIKKALKPNPLDRPQFSKEFYDEFQTILSGKHKDRDRPETSSPERKKLLETPGKTTVIGDTKHALQRRHFKFGLAIIIALISLLLFRDKLTKKNLSELDQGLASVVTSDLGRAVSEIDPAIQIDNNVLQSSPKTLITESSPIAPPPAEPRLDVTVPVPTRPMPTIVPTQKPEPPSSKPAIKDKCVIISIDYTNIPSDVISGPMISQIREGMGKRGWTVQQSIQSSDRNSSHSQLAEKYGCRYILSGRFSVRDGAGSDYLPGISFAYAEASLTLIDTQTEYEEFICEESVKENSKSRDDARKKAVRELFKKVPSIVLKTI